MCIRSNYFYNFYTKTIIVLPGGGKVRSETSRDLIFFKCCREFNDTGLHLLVKIVNIRSYSLFKIDKVRIVSVLLL